MSILLNFEIMFLFRKLKLPRGTFSIVISGGRSSSRDIPQYPLLTEECIATTTWNCYFEKHCLSIL